MAVVWSVGHYRKRMYIASLVNSSIRSKYVLVKESSVSKKRKIEFIKIKNKLMKLIQEANENKLN